MARQEPWTNRQRDMLREQYVARVSYAGIATALNEKFDTSRTAENVRSYAASYLKLRRPHIRPGVVWTEPMDEVLRDGVKALHTMARIARDLDLTMSAVNRRRLALGITVPKGIRRSPEELAQRKVIVEQRNRDAAELKRRNRLMNYVPPEYRQEAPLNLAPDVVTNPLNLTLDEVTQDQCRWITSDALSPPLYCGHPVHTGCWCEKHHAVVTVPKRPEPVWHEPVLQEQEPMRMAA